MSPALVSQNTYSIILMIVAVLCLVLGIVIFLFRHKIEQWGRDKELTELTKRYLYVQGAFEKAPPGLVREQLFDEAELIRQQILDLQTHEENTYKPNTLYEPEENVISLNVFKSKKQNKKIG